MYDTHDNVAVACHRLHRICNVTTSSYEGLMFVYFGIPLLAEQQSRKTSNIDFASRFSPRRLEHSGLGTERHTD